MNDNIHYFPSPRTTTASRTDNFARKVIERVRNPISVKPSYVTASAFLNRAITNLEKKGWQVHTPPDGNIACSLHRGRVHIVVELDQAQKIQRLLEGSEARKQN